MAVKGTFKDLSFLELLQLMHLARKTGRLEVTHDNRWAMIIFNEGAVWHVEPRGYRGATGEEILFALIADESAAFTFQRVHVLPALDRTIQISTDSLILEGVKRLDDERAVAQQAIDNPQDTSNQLAQVLKVRQGVEAKVRYVPQNVKRILQLIDGHRSIGDVVRESQLDAPTAAQIIKDLITQEILDSVGPEENTPTE